MHRLALGVGVDVDIDARLVGLGDNMDMLRVAVERPLAIGAEVYRPGFGQGGHVRHLAEDLRLNLVQHVPFTSSRLQPVMVSARILG